MSASVMTLLFHAPDLRGPWQLHRASPISSDVRSSRSAGAVIVADGRLLRPGQNCALRYGRSLVWNEILELSPGTYRERTLGQLDARTLPGFDGVHHYHRAGDWEAIDVRRQSPVARLADRPQRDAAHVLLPMSRLVRAPWRA